MAGVVFWKVISTLKTKKKPDTFFFPAGEKNTRCRTCMLCLHFPLFYEKIWGE